MTTTATPELPLILQLIKDRPAGELYLLSVKQTVADGLKDCERPVISNAFLSQDQSQLTICFSHIKTSFNVKEGRLLFSCTCRNTNHRSHCSHIITSWACLKRHLSPTSLSTVRFNQVNMQHFTALTAQNNSVQPGNPQGLGQLVKRHAAEHLPAISNKKEAIPQPEANSASYRLLLYADEEGVLNGNIFRGNEQLNSWSSRNLPPDIRAFLLKRSYFSGDAGYLEHFIRLGKGNWPIVYQDQSGTETTLHYLSDRPLRATLRFENKNGSVQLLPGIANGAPLPEKVVVSDELLLDVISGTIHPLSNSDIWELLDDFASEDIWNDDVDDFDDDLDEDFDDEPDDDEYYAASPNPFADDDDDFTETLFSEQLRQGVTLTYDELNSAGLLFTSIEKKDPLDDIYFFHDNQPTAPFTVDSSYRLLAPRQPEGDRITLTPCIICNSVERPFSRQAFGFLNNSNHTGLSRVMRAKKRYRNLLETAFILPGEPSRTERARLIRTGLSAKEFGKRDLRSAAISFLERFALTCQAQGLVLTVQADGWYVTGEDRPAQARFLKILLELFGADAFAEGAHSPGSIALPQTEFLSRLPELMTRLSDIGATLDFGSTPLQSASLQFSLDATSSNLDWFELKPEIRIDGELLTEEELKSLLNGSPILQREGRLLLLDELSSQVLAMFGEVLTPRRNKKGKAEPVQVPRLQILDWLQMRKHGVEVKLSPHDAETLESLLNFEQLPKPALPAGLIADLRHYQQDAWHWLAFLYKHRFGACLADDMGLGKTLQGITLLAGIMTGTLPSAAPPGSPHLVVAPPSLLFNWEAEIARFLPAAKTLLYSGTSRSSDSFGDYDIIITSYGIIQRDIEKLAGHRFDVIIFDETQVVKNLQAATTNAVRKLKGAFALALTGTPVENHLGEYYAIMDLCLPGLLGSHDEFNRQIAKGGPSATQRLIQRTKPFVLRRTKQMIAAELPPKIETDIRLELSPKQKALYQRTIEEVKGQVQDAYQSHAPAQARIIALTAILRLRQICLAPALAAATATDSSPKLEFLREQLEELRDEGHSALVFSQFTGYLDLIEKNLKAGGFTPLRLDGSTPVPHRKKLVQTFQNGNEPMVFLISLKAGGKGLNLTRATYVYHMDPWWNPAVENQASDRAHRIGQTEQVTITRLIMRHTIEEKMMALKARKLELYKALLEDGAGAGGAGLTREDFEFLLG